jgi:hypothetical protein
VGDILKKKEEMEEEEKEEEDVQSLVSDLSSWEGRTAAFTADSRTSNKVGHRKVMKCTC